MRLSSEHKLTHRALGNGRALPIVAQQCPRSPAGVLIWENKQKWLRGPFVAPTQDQFNYKTLAQLLWWGERDWSTIAPNFGGEGHKTGCLLSPSSKLLFLLQVYSCKKRLDCNLYNMVTPKFRHFTPFLWKEC